MFLYFSKKGILIICLLSVALFSFGLLLTKLVSAETVTSPYNLTIVIDAGHGGIDGGSTGTTTGVTECELNLIYANKLEKLLKSAGIKVVKTRNNLDGLYDAGSKNFKKDDMQKRSEIIKQAKAQAVISIHMNKFSLNSEKGSQIFYQQNDEKSKKLADCIKDELVSKIENARELTLGGDFFICKCDNIPSVIVECGFLSNEKEELLLQDEEYQDKLCYSIFCGIIKYFNISL